MAKKTIAPPSSAEKLFAEIIESYSGDPLIGTRKMFGATGLNVNGKGFAMIFKDKLVVKLPKDRVDALVASQVGEHFDPGHGRQMKEWLTVAEERQAEWKPLVVEAHQFVAENS